MIILICIEKVDLTFSFLYNIILKYTYVHNIPINLNIRKYNLTS